MEKKSRAKQIKEPKSFEEALDQLEKIALELEKGEIGLEEAIEKYEEGIVLSRFCHAKLGEAEKKIEMLQKNSSGEIIKKKVKVDEETGELLDDSQGSLL